MRRGAKAHRGPPEVPDTGTSGASGRIPTQQETATPLLREPNFRLLLTGRTISRLGDGAAPIAMAFAVLHLTGSATDLGLVLGARAVPTAVLLVVGGVWADRLPRQLVMFVADVTRLLVQVGVAVLLATGRASTLDLAAMSFVYGCASAFFMPATTGLIPSTVSAANIQGANALLAITSGISSIIGPALAGLLIAQFNLSAVFFCDAATFAVSAACLISMRIAATERQPSGTRPSFILELRSGWTEVASRTWLWTTILAQGAMFFFVIGPYSVLGPDVANTALGGVSAWALISAAFAAGQLCGGVVAFRWRARRPILIGLTAVLLECPAIALLAAQAPAFLTASAQLLGGAGIALFLTLWDTTMQRVIPADRLARVSAYDWLGTTVLLPLSYPIAGVLAGVADSSAVLWVSAAFVLLINLPILALAEVRTLVVKSPGDENK